VVALSGSENPAPEGRHPDGETIPSRGLLLGGDDAALGSGFGAPAGRGGWIVHTSYVNLLLLSVQSFCNNLTVRFVLPERLARDD